MAFCGKCGSALVDDARFCGACGALASGVSNPAPRVQQTLASETPAVHAFTSENDAKETFKGTATPRAKKRSRWGIIVALISIVTIGLIAVAGVLGFAYFRHERRGDPNQLLQEAKKALGDTDQLLQEANNALKAGDASTGLRKLLQAAELGNVQAQLEAGVLLGEQGDGDDSWRPPGIKPNPREAIKWYTKAAEQGEPQAAYFLALSHFVGLNGLKEDRREGLKWAFIARYLGSPEASKLYMKVGQEMPDEEVIEIAMSGLLWAKNHNLSSPVSVSNTPEAEKQPRQSSTARSPSQAQISFFEAAKKIESTYTGNPQANNADAALFLDFNRVYGKKLCCGEYGGDASKVYNLLFENGYAKSAAVWKSQFLNPYTGELKWHMYCD